MRRRFRPCHYLIDADEYPQTAELERRCVHMLADLSCLGTFVGAVCFLVGALLLLPERTEEVT